MPRAAVRTLLNVLLIPAIWCFSAFPGLAGSARSALVIGISAYEEVTPLVNPSQDARRTAESLAALGFEVETVLDSNASQLSGKLAAFRQRSAGAEVAIVYFAGHGMQIDGGNYLLPRDTRLDDPLNSALKMDLFVDAFGDGVGSKLLIVDACRNNPLATRSLSTATTRGLARLNHSVAELAVLFSAQPGHVAFDGSGGNSPFAVALNETLMRNPSIKLTDALVDITSQVRSQTSGRQIPYFEGSLSAHVMFTKTALNGASKQTSPAVACEPTTPVRVAMQADGFFEAPGDAKGYRIETRAGGSIEICRQEDGVAVSGYYTARYSCDQIRDAENEGVGYYFREPNGTEAHLWLHTNLTETNPELELGVYYEGEEDLWMTSGWEMCPPN